VRLKRATLVATGAAVLVGTAAVVLTIGTSEAARKPPAPSSAASQASAPGSGPSPAAPARTPAGATNPVGPSGAPAGKSGGQQGGAAAGAPPGAAGAAPPCPGTALTAQFEANSGKAGQRSGRVGLRNGSGAVCSVIGFPEVQLVGRGDDPISTYTVHDGAARLVLLAPGQTSWATLTWSTQAAADEPATGPCQPSAERLAVFAPHQQTQLNVPFAAGPVCVHGQFMVGPLTTP
jgi:hypothetical protein